MYEEYVYIDRDEPLEGNLGGARLSAGRRKGLLEARRREVMAAVAAGAAAAATSYAAATAAAARHRVAAAAVRGKGWRADVADQRSHVLVPRILFRPRSQDRRVQRGC